MAQSIGSDQMNIYFDIETKNTSLRSTVNYEEGEEDFCITFIRKITLKKSSVRKFISGKVSDVLISHI